MPETLADKIRRDISTMAVRAGIDTSVCEICEEPLDDSEPWRRGMDGCGAHDSCLRATGIRLPKEE